MKRLLTILLSVMVLCSIAPAAHAQLSKDELKARFKQRDAQLRDLRKQERIGETLDGYVEAVSAQAAADDAVAAFIRAENTDRKALYQILADEINAENPKAKVKATAALMGERNAKRTIERAEPNELLRVAPDHWIRMRDYPRFEKLLKEKAKGTIGETSAGLIAIVKPEDEKDAKLRALVDEENEARLAEYESLAKQQSVKPDVIAQKMAERNFKNARTGDMLRDANGSWRKK